MHDIIFVNRLLVLGLVIIYPKEKDNQLLFS